MKRPAYYAIHEDGPVPYGPDHKPLAETGGRPIKWFRVFRTKGAASRYYRRLVAR